MKKMNGKKRMTAFCADEPKDKFPKKFRETNENRYKMREKERVREGKGKRERKTKHSRPSYKA